MTPHPDLEAEQAHIDHAYSRLDAMRARTRRTLEAALRQPRGGTHQAREEREVVVAAGRRRLAQLDIGGQSLSFGRIDRSPPRPAGPLVGEAPAPESYHIGRLGVYGEDQEPLVVDWRAPVAEPFYRATGVDPMGLSRRRHFVTDGRRLVGIEDELFATGAGPGAPWSDAGSDLDGQVGSGALLAALERSRSSHMRDIVATVQREQDEVIRAPLQGVLVVQGGPGTGKTAVALHRAAYLLYTHRFPLERQGVLVVGPSQVFLRFIERVLPSLGESGVVLSTVGGLVPGVTVRAREDGRTAALKGRPVMAAVVANAVKDRERPLGQTAEIPFGSTVLRMTRSASRAAVGAARRRPGTHNSKRRYVETALARSLATQHLGAAGRAGSGAEREADLLPEIRRLKGFREVLDRIWPRLHPEELIHDLFGSTAFLKLAARGVLGEDDVAALHRARSASLESIPWTRADLALIDEAAVLLGPVRGARDGEGARRSYGHVVVDEAQDLSPMELRMISRRSLSGSMTIVGDLAQATGPQAPAGWEDVTAHLPSNRPPRLVELSVNYRTPAEVMALAGRVLAVVAPGLAMPRSVRSTGAEPVVLDAPGERLAETVVSAVRAELAASRGGTVALIAAESAEPHLLALLAGSGIEVSEAREQGIGPAVTVVAVPLAKGLEFDSVVVVDPASIVREHGGRSLFVALTRPTRRMSVVTTHGSERWLRTC